MRKVSWHCVILFRIIDIVGSGENVREENRGYSSNMD
jgi:hypothetical protein